MKPEAGPAVPASVVAVVHRIRLLRQHEGRTVRQLADRAEISRSMPTQIEFGQSQPEPGLQVQRSILERLGCQACCSDIDIRWDIERDFVVGPDGALRDF